MENSPARSPTGAAIKKIIILTSCIFSFSISQPAFGKGNPMQMPHGVRSSMAVKHKKHMTSVPSIVFDAYVRFFQHFISPVDGDRCPMYPSCSTYSRQAIKRHGAVLGVVMTADRLMHEGDEQRFAPLVNLPKKTKFYDPLDNNDFWWKK